MSKPLKTFCSDKYYLRAVVLSLTCYLRTLPSRKADKKLCSVSIPPVSVTSIDLQLILFAVDWEVFQLQKLCSSLSTSGEAEQREITSNNFVSQFFFEHLYLQLTNATSGKCANKKFKDENVLCTPRDFEIFSLTHRVFESFLSVNEQLLLVSVMFIIYRNENRLLSHVLELSKIVLLTRKFWKIWVNIHWKGPLNSPYT